MDRAEIDRWTGRHWLALAGVCIAEATFITAPATAAQNQPEEVVVTGSRIRQNPRRELRTATNGIRGRGLAAQQFRDFAQLLSRLRP